MLVNKSYADLLIIKEKLNEWLRLKKKEIIDNQDFYVIFISYGKSDHKCRVWNQGGADFEKLIQQTIKFIEKIFEKDKSQLFYLKIDLVFNKNKRSWSDVQFEVSSQNHNNHYRKGISFSEKFDICFLEQEMYGKAIIKSVAYDKPNFFDEKNLNDAIKAKYPALKKYLKLEEIQTVWTFDTIGTFYENGSFIDLYSTGCENGTRVLTKNPKDEIREIVLGNRKFLIEQILSDGKFIYGYFPAYDREIKSYNTIRHCTAIYSLIETLEVEYKEEYLEKIKIAIQYALDHFYKESSQKAFMIDGVKDNEEIKLGSNAAAIFMFAKYQEITKDNTYQIYAEKLAEGIRFMVNQEGETIHVLNYPSLTLKEKFRIVYHDGEAALGLLRLYQLNKNEVLLQTVKLMFENFMNQNYDKYHDHWLSYCTNELTKICPEEKYFRFGLNNYLKHMQFIKNRKTAYATFLEMMMSAYKMVVRMKEQGLSDLCESAKFEELKELIELRVEFQRTTGFFYPEVAMYMARPDKILDAFYVRHDRFRARIDDQEHNLSGLIAYLNYF